MGGREYYLTTATRAMEYILDVDVVGLAEAR